jgi:hypothetical protein
MEIKLPQQQPLRLQKYEHADILASGRKVRDAICPQLPQLRSGSTHHCRALSSRICRTGVRCFPKPGSEPGRMAVDDQLSESERAAYVLMFRQLAQTARAIHDMHKATDDLRRVRGLSAAVIAASKVVEASATAQTIKAHPMTMEELREQHPGASEEALRARLIAERSRGGSPIPTTLTKPEKTLQQAGPIRPEEPSRDHHPNPGIER